MEGGRVVVEGIYSLKKRGKSVVRFLVIYWGFFMNLVVFLGWDLGS